MIHQLKTEHGFFEDVISGRKTFEVRLNDRDFRVGDFAALNELTQLTLPPEGKCIETGRCCLVEIVYILNDCRFLQDRYVVLGIRPCHISTTGDIDLVRGGHNIYAVPCYNEPEVTF